MVGDMGTSINDDPLDIPIDNCNSEFMCPAFQHNFFIVKRLESNKELLTRKIQSLTTENEQLRIKLEQVQKDMKNVSDYVMNLQKSVDVLRDIKGNLNQR